MNLTPEQQKQIEKGKAFIEQMAKNLAINRQLDPNQMVETPDGVIPLWQAFMPECINHMQLMKSQEEATIWMAEQGPRSLVPTMNGRH